MTDTFAEWNRANRLARLDYEKRTGQRTSRPYPKPSAAKSNVRKSRRLRVVA